MGGPASKQSTYDAILSLPDHVTGEILDGELVTSPRPAAPHLVASSAILGDLLPAYGRRRQPTGPGGWWILAELELHCGGHVLVPDIAGWRIERLPSPGNTAALTIVPDWICEIVSPSSVRRDRVQKMRIYSGLGVEYLWLADPLARVLEAYRLSEGRWLVLGTWTDKGDTPRVPPFDAVTLDLAEWWLPEPPSDEPAPST